MTSSSDVARPSPVRFLTIFVVVMLLGFSLQILPWVDSTLISPYLHALAQVCGWLIEAFGGSVRVAGDTLWQPFSTVGVRIDNGCSGIEAAILMASAVLAFPVAFRLKVVGLLVGVGAILVVNVFRVISLFYLLQYSQQWFDWAHLYLWDLLIVLDGLLAFFLWARWARRRPTHAIDRTLG